MSRRYRFAAWSSLAASLAIHGLALGGLVVSPRSCSPDLVLFDRSPGGGAPGGAMIVHLVGAAAASGQLRAATAAPEPQSARRTIEVAAARTPELEKRQEPLPRSVPPVSPPRAVSTQEAASRLPRHVTAPLPAGAPVEIARASASPPVAPSAATAGSYVRRPLLAAAPPGSGSAAVQRAGAGSGSGTGYGTGPFDRVARPARAIRPHYPPRARQRGEEADVAVQVWVGARGEVDRVAVAESAGDEFDAAAVEAVRKARFHPALRDGEQVPSRVALLLHFRLDR
jgi:protein TonB